MKEIDKNLVQGWIDEFTGACNDVHKIGLTVETMGKVSNELLGLTVRINGLLNQTNNPEERDMLSNVLDMAKQISNSYQKAYMNKEAIDLLQNYLSNGPYAKNQSEKTKGKNIV